MLATGGTFELSITVPPSYPTKPPSIRFVSRIWHPNVAWKVRGGSSGSRCLLSPRNAESRFLAWMQTGEICLDVLSSQWSPAWNLSSACTAVIALLDDPEPDSPLNVDAGE